VPSASDGRDSIIPKRRRQLARVYLLDGAARGRTDNNAGHHSPAFEWYYQSGLSVIRPRCHPASTRLVQPVLGKPLLDPKWETSGPATAGLADSNKQVNHGSAVAGLSMPEPRRTLAE